MMTDHYTDLIRRFQKTQINCGVTLRGREDSEHRIRERLLQLELEGHCGSKEYQLLNIILERITKSDKL